MKKQTLEQQLKAATQQKELAVKKEKALIAKVEAAKLKNKPKSITGKVKTLKDVLSITKPSKEVLALIKYNGSDELLLHSKYEMICVLLAKALNEGWIPKMDGSENRWYSWYSVSSGFEFDGARCVTSSACADSASRLCFKTKELAEYAGKTFTNEYRNFITK